jgi:hypothetical protein
VRVGPRSLSRIVNRLPRRLALVTVLVLAVTGAASCGQVQPPALSLARDRSSEPFFTLTADELFAELNKNSSPGGSTSIAPLVDSSKVAELLTGKVRPKLVEQILADRKIVPSEADRAAVERMAQQQQSPPSDEEIAFQTNLVALANTLSNDFFSKPGNDIEEYARRYYDQRKDTFTEPAQTCLHVVTVDAPVDAPPDPLSTPRPTAAQIETVQDDAQAMRQRLNTETWEAVHASSGRSAAEVPGGDLGCRSEEDLPPDLVAGIKDLQPGAISQPIRWPLGFVIARLDDRKVQRTPPFEEVRNDAITATKTSFGNQFVTELLENMYKSFVVSIDPRFGRWSVEQGQVLPPEGAAAAPTAPTTTTLPTLGGGGPRSEPAPAPPTGDR